VVAGYEANTVRAVDGVPADAANGPVSTGVGPRGFIPIRMFLLVGGALSIGGHRGSDMLSQ
jgi:hypothetical protein